MCLWFQKDLSVVFVSLCVSLFVSQYGKRVVAVCVVQGGSDATFDFSLLSPHVCNCTTLRSIQKHYSMALLEITTKATAIVKAEHEEEMSVKN